MLCVAPCIPARPSSRRILLGAALILHPPRRASSLTPSHVQEPDAAKRKEIAAQLQARAYQTVPYVMWGEFKPVSAIRGLTHTELMKTGIPVMWNVEKP